MKKLITLILLMSSMVLTAQTTWYEISTPSNKQLNTIHFASSSVGYIGGNDSTLLKTIDGGKTWNALSFSGINFFLGGEHFVNLIFMNDSVGFATVGPYSGTYQTNDGGITWSEITFSGVMCYNQGMYFWDADNGIIGGSGCFQGEHMERYASGTLTPSTINTPSWTANDMVLDIDFLDANYGLAVSESRFLRTTDGGANWDTIPSGFDHLLTSIEVVNDTLAYAGYIQVSTGFGALVTHDGGFTWAMEMDMATFAYPDYLDVAEAPNGYLYAGGTGWTAGVGMMFEDKGTGWWYYDVGQTIRSIDAYGDSTVFAVGDSGYVITNVDPALLSYSENLTESASFELYPNPAKDQLQVQAPENFDLSNATIRIVSMSGQVVSSSNQWANTLDVSMLDPGVYVMQITTASGHYTEQFVKE